MHPEYNLRFTVHTVVEIGHIHELDTIWTECFLTKCPPRNGSSSSKDERKENPDLAAHPEKTLGPTFSDAVDKSCLAELETENF